MKKHGFPLIFAAAALLFPISGAWPQAGEFPRLLGPYLGQKPSGTTPEMFAPGIVSTALDELNSVFSPDGTEFYFCVRNQAASTLFVMKSVQGTWGRPEPLPFSGLYNDIDVSLTPDGQTLYFCSNKPASGSGAPKRDYDIWMCAREGGSWGPPERLGDEVNSSSEDFFPIVTKSRTIYFNSQRGGTGKNDIYFCRWVKGKYAPAEKLGPEVNSEFREFDAFVSPDEDFVIFTSERPDGDRFGDLYISYKDSAGKWTPARNMGKEINSPGPEYGTGLTPDGKYLLFTRLALAPIERTSSKALTVEDYLRMHNSPDNGSANIWWVDARIIQSLR